MKLIRYDYPEVSLGGGDFNRWLRDMFRDMDHIRSSFFDNRHPGTGNGSRFQLGSDFYESEGAYHAVFELPGIDKSSINVELENSVLTVSGEHTEEFDGEKNSFTFSRSLAVPDGVDRDKVEAAFEDGVLQITLSKSDERKPKLITIN